MRWLTNSCLAWWVTKTSSQSMSCLWTLVWKSLRLLLITPLLPASSPLIWVNGSGPQIVLSSKYSLPFVFRPSKTCFKVRMISNRNVVNISRSRPVHFLACHPEEQPQPLSIYDLLKKVNYTLLDLNINNSHYWLVLTLCDGSLIMLFLNSFNRIQKLFVKVIISQKDK